MRTVRVSDLVFDGIRNVADREGISMASVIDRLLTFSCSVCGQPVFPQTKEGFRLFNTSKTKAFDGWMHSSCKEEEEEEK